MAHTIREKAKLLSRVRRIRGQVEALERALEEERGCTAVMQQIAAVRGAVNGLMAEVLEDHIRGHVFNPQTDADAEAERIAGAEELVELVRTYLK
ncbi:MAG: metal/formaldehyde-sensitive transcriptional repressor [Chloroflexota bacterium]|nr:metal/formaldehyde-sensitive transcriptional repressor [Chloroflexota bacterium]